MARELTVFELIDTTASFGGKQIPLLVLVDDYARRVIKFHNEQGGERPGDIFWGISDYVGMLWLRSAIERCMVSVAERSTSPLVAAADQVLVSFTRDAPQWVHGLDPDAPSEPWWWSRIPETGLVAEEYLFAVARSRTDKQD